jgi:hypothetical protein
MLPPLSLLRTILANKLPPLSIMRKTKNQVVEVRIGSVQVTDNDFRSDLVTSEEQGKNRRLPRRNPMPVA